MIQLNVFGKPEIIKITKINAYKPLKMYEIIILDGLKNYSDC